uniref:Uncharacterized protein n=1 Tax=Trichobilharzia regenti TaxID=157069 RepID=A0AA85IZA5_TRIRE|nr:unnamed protein product [Trichobilharzia regenti]
MFSMKFAVVILSVFILSKFVYGSGSMESQFLNKVRQLHACFKEIGQQLRDEATAEQNLMERFKKNRTEVTLLVNDQYREWLTA